MYVHEARLRLTEGSDEGAPGAAVTAALCGHWKHDGPCRWPHHNGISAGPDDTTTIRVVFAADETDEPEVRRRISEALATGSLEAPEGSARWTVQTEGPATPAPREIR